MTDWKAMTMKLRMVRFTRFDDTDVWIRADSVAMIEMDEEDVTSVITLDGGKVVCVIEKPLDVLTAIGYGE